MKRGITLLILWLLTADFFAPVFIAPTPPGGVLLPFYIVIASIPFGAFLYAHYGDRISAVICYGLLAGFFFGWALFFDDVPIMIGFMGGDEGALLYKVLFKVGLCTFLMPLVCAGAFAVGRKLFTARECLENR